MMEKVSQIHEIYLLDQQLFCWRHFSKTEVVQNTDLNILALYKKIVVWNLYKKNLILVKIEIIEKISKV